jgi:hypothetical protein
MTQPTNENGVWVHHCWDESDRNAYPATEMPCAWYESEEEDDEDDEDAEDE